MYQNRVETEGRRPQTRIKTILLQRGLSQRDLSKKSGICESYISYFIHGRMLPGNMEKAQIAAALDMPQGEVFE